jgi:N6-adenosine-specific RNA methylase IME4
MTDALAKLSSAALALSEAKTLPEVKHILDIAEAARTYAKAAKLGLEAQNSAAAIKILAEYKAGELLGQLERDTSFHGNQAVILQPGKSPSEYSAILTESDIAPTTAHRWQVLARTLPEEEVREHIAAATPEQRELTSAGLMRLAVAKQREQRHSGMSEAPPLPTDKYRIWYADPPWRYSNSGVITNENGNEVYPRALKHYPDMSIEELCSMGADIRAACEPDAVLFLWVTSPLLEECFPVINAWGFQYKTSFVWDKVAHNFGHYNSVRHELLLVCVRGSCTPDNKTLYDSVLSIERTEHSVKPEEFRRIIDDLYTWGRRIELFARRPVEGWEAWGNQA